MDSHWIICVVVLYVVDEGACQLSDNTPPVMWLDRNWRISSSEPVGSVVMRVHADDNEKDELVFGLEPLTHGSTSDDLPFRIDNHTGVVYIKDSLQDKVGKNMLLYVTVSDGKLTAKNEVWVNIVNASSAGEYTAGVGNRIRPPFLQLPNFGNRHPPPPISNVPQGVSSFYPPPPSHFPNPHPPSSTAKPRRTYLEPVTSSALPDGAHTTATDTTPSPPPGPVASLDSLAANPTPPAADPPVKSPPDLTVTLIPVLSVCAVVFGAGIIAVLFRKKIYIARTKSSKDDIRKESNGGIVLQEDPSVAMQHWRGPRAFSNRYEPWERDPNAHQMVERRESETTKDSDHWEFPRHRLKVFNILGEGAFGQVWKCEALDIDGKEGVSVVAVKTLKENATEKERLDLVSELQVMKTLEPHANVVRLLGCCTEKEPLFVIMEYVSGGKLQSFLRNSRAERYYGNMHGKSKSLTSRDLTSFVYQVARGMDYLSSKGIIHRDLAARNVLITDEHVCKVADFGFARDVVATLVYERKSEGRLPIRWMAPESLYDNIFSVKSDVWSFGVLIWEVVTLGSTPYPGLSAADVMRKVRDGHRLEKPEHCRRELYNIMYYCWDQAPAERPAFDECVTLLEKLLHTETDYIELERFPDHSYYNMVSLSGEKL